MQSNMNNSNLNDNDQGQWTGKTILDRAVSQVKSINPEDLKNRAAEITTRVRDVSTGFYGDSVGYVRRNPVSSALGMAALGFFVGMLVSKSRKSY